MVNGKQIPGGKTKLNDWGVRIPTIAVWPGKIKEGTVCDKLVDFSDFLPGILGMLDLPEPEYEISGKSFAGALTGKNYTPRDWVYAQKSPGKYMIRSRDWKLLGDGKIFDMKSDIHEESPILPDQDTPESERARTELDSIIKDLKLQ